MQLEALTAILMKNPTDRPVRIPSDMIAPAGWEVEATARPTKVTIPPGAAVMLRAEYCARSRASWTSDRGRDPEDTDTPMAIPSAVASVAPALVPGDDTAARFVAEVWHESLLSVKRAMAELKRAGAAERGEVLPAEGMPKFH